MNTANSWAYELFENKGLRGSLIPDDKLLCTVQVTVIDH
jgi:hypothetical protein